jgi:hypothetical protein
MNAAARLFIVASVLGLSVPLGLLRRDRFLEQGDCVIEPASIEIDECEIVHRDQCVNERATETACHVLYSPGQRSDILWRMSFIIVSYDRKSQEGLAFDSRVVVRDKLERMR